MAAAAIRGTVFGAPIVAAVATSAVLSDLVPAPRGIVDRLLWWLGLLSASTAVLILVDRAARRLLPLAALLKLSLVFPDRVPSRFSTALRSDTTRGLARRLERAEVHGTTRAGAEELLALVAQLNRHDRFTRGHAERVRALSDLLACQLDLDPADRERLRWVALLHDIGKLRVPAEILRKTGAPTAEEWAVIRTHPDAGMDLVEGPIADWLGEWTSAIGQHHEKFDGSGYPRGLAGYDIALAARIVTVADVFDVITAVRSYKKPVTIQEARRELTRCAGTHFDPVLVRAFLQISIGDLRRAMGPIAWLAQVSILGRLAAVPAASTVASGVMAITGLGLGPVIRGEPGITSPTPISGAEVGSDGAPELPGGPSQPTTGDPGDEGPFPVGPTTTSTTVPGDSGSEEPPVTVPPVTVPPVTVTVTPVTVTVPPVTVPPVTLPPVTVTLPPVTLPPLLDLLDGGGIVPDLLDPLRRPGGDG